MYEVEWEFLCSPPWAWSVKWRLRALLCGVSQGNGEDLSSGSSHSALHMTLDELRQVNRYAESTKSLSYLPQVSGMGVILPQKIYIYKHTILLLFFISSCKVIRLHWFWDTLLGVLSLLFSYFVRYEWKPPAVLKISFISQIEYAILTHFVSFVEEKRDYNLLITKDCKNEPSC